MLSFVLYPDKALRTVCEPVTIFDDSLSNFVADLTHAMHTHDLLGVSANMVGNCRQIIVLNGTSLKWETESLCMINPVITMLTTQTETHIEAAPVVPFIEAKIERCRHISVSYQTLTGEAKIQEFEGFHAHVIQHEVDYLHGKTFLERLPKVKAQILKDRMQKLIRANSKVKPHVHGAHCNH